MREKHILKKNPFAIALPPPNYVKYLSVNRNLKGKLINKKVTEQNKIVSIIMPVRNGEHTIEVAINSILDQTYNDIELIVADCNSTDKTLAILDKYSDYLTYFSESDDGPPDAFNKCLTLFSGKYITHVLADDSIEPNYIERMVRFLELNQNLDFAYGDLNLYSTNNKFLYTTSGEDDYKKNIEYLNLFDLKHL
jgi:glycosyltransferase involved in cell wall biosynthesis